ncbi:hypothetical protein BH23PLA1_BH23PLA1_27370 [soil metagenome]
MRVSILPAALMFIFGTLMAGCEGDKQSTVESAVGVEEGSHVETKDIDTRRVNIVKEQRVEDAETGQVIDRHTEKTPATITEERRVEREVQIKTGDTVITEQGDTTDGIDD